MSSYSSYHHRDRGELRNEMQNWKNNTNFDERLFSDSELSGKSTIQSSILARKQLNRPQPTGSAATIDLSARPSHQAPFNFRIGHSIHSNSIAYEGGNRYDRSPCDINRKITITSDIRSTRPW